MTWAHTCHPALATATTTTATTTTTNPNRLYGAARGRRAVRGRGAPLGASPPGTVGAQIEQAAIADVEQAPTNYAEAQ